MFRTSTHFLLHRYLHELPELICYRGIIFGIVAVTPFLSAMMTNDSYLAQVNISLNCIKLAYIIRIMLTTFKWLKLLFALIAK